MQDKPQKNKANNFVTLLNFIVDPAVIVDEKGHFLVVNDAFTDLTGLSKKEVIGTPFLDISNVTAESKKILLENLVKRMKDLAVEPYEISFTDKIGENRYVEVKAKKISYNGQPADLVLFRDITRRKRNARQLEEYSKKMETLVNEKVKEIKESAQKLGESEEKYRKQFEEAFDAIFVADAETGIIIDCNRAASELVGREKSELVGEHQRILHPSEEIEGESSRTFKQHLKEKEGQILEAKVITKRGEIKDVAIKANVFELRGKKLVQGIFRDVTEQKKAEEALKESEKKYRELINGMNDTAWVIGLDGNFVDVNDAAVKVLGYSREELLSMGPPDIDNSLTVEQIRDLVKRMPADQIQVFKTAHTTKDGKTIPVEISSSLVTYQGKQAILSIARDITERKKSEEKLIASEKKYRKLFENLKLAEKQLLEERDRAQNYLDVASVMFVALDTEGRITMLNRKGCEILKCTAEEALGKNWFDYFLPKKVKDNVKKHFHLILAEKANFPPYHENPILAKNGEIHLIGWHNTLLRNREGQVIGTLSSGEDITEWKQAQQALTDSEEKFRAISTYASDAIILLDRKDKVVYWNLAAEKIFGYTKEDAIGKKLNTLVVPSENHKHHLEMLKKLFKNKAQISEKRTEIKALRKDGTEFPIELSAKVLQLKGAQYVLEIIRDVSERKKMEETLAQERDMLEAVTENIGAGLIIISKDYHALWANNFIKQYKGDVEGKLCYATLNTLDAPCPDCGVKKIFEDGVTIDAHEYCSTTIDGNPYWVEIIATPIKDKEGNVIAALELAVDITEKKILQNKLAEYSQKLKKKVEKRTEQLKQTQAKLVKSERLATIGELAAMVGHDLRNPLTGIMGAAYYLKTKHAAEIGAKGREMLETIQKAIDYSNKIVNDLLEYSRDLKLELEETTPKEMLQKALLLFEVQDKIRIIDATEDKPAVKADTEKILRVFDNIIKNAVDAMPDGGTLTIKSRKVKGKLEIAFKDTGTGMSEETLSKLESPLFTTKAKGMGFGLSICRRIVEAHGGKISLESEIGKGTKVTVTISVNPKPVDEVEEKWIFSQSMLSATLTA